MRVDTLLLVLPAVAGALGEITFRPDRMRAALSSTMMATDLADYLVRKGATFREAHGAVGALVRESEVPASSCTRSRSRRSKRRTRASARCVRRALGRYQRGARETEGGTGPNAVRAQIESARSSLV